MAATDEVISQPESIIKMPQSDNVINTNGREKQFREVKSSNWNTSAEKWGIAILGESIIKYANGYENKKNN